MQCIEGLIITITIYYTPVSSLLVCLPPYLVPLLLFATPHQ